MKWLIANPDKSLGECAAAHGYTQSWLSIVIHSDAFQAQLRELQDKSYTDVRMDVKAKITGIAHLALDKLAEQLPVSADPKFTLDVADKTLRALGYGAPARGQPTINVQVNNNQVTPAELAEARRLASQRGVVIEQEPLALEATPTT